MSSRRYVSVRRLGITISTGSTSSLRGFAEAVPREIRESESETWLWREREW